MLFMLAASSAFTFLCRPILRPQTQTFTYPFRAVLAVDANIPALIIADGY